MLLRNFEKNDTILIDSFECLAGSQLGDNYMSVVKRVKICGRFNNSDGKDL